MKRITPLLCITIIFYLFLGIYAGHKVTAAYKDVEIMKLKAQRDKANDDLAFWQMTLRCIVEGDQIMEPIAGRVSKGN